MEPPQRSKSNPTLPTRSAAGSGKAPAKDTRSGAGPQSSRPSDPHDPIPTGRVRHDDRGNAVWDWLKETGRNAIGTTSRLLKKLELSHLEVEDKKDEELRIQEDRDPGGGYDPYNQSNNPPGGPRRKGP
jgi:hypothetical protein